MKKQIIFLIALGTLLSLGSCRDFQKMNEDPNSVLEKDVQPEMLLNRSIFDAQQDGHISDRIFMRYWVYNTGYASRNGGDPYLSVFSTDDSWNSDFWGDSYLSGWIKNPTIGIQLGTKRIAAGDDATKPALKNIVQMCRIWRAAMLAQMTDNYGPINTLGAFDGTASEFKTVEDAYKEVLKELSEAVAAIDLADAKKLTGDESLCDPIYKGDLVKWARFANSMRMRYAMRLSNLNPALAQSEFEKAVADTKGYIADNTQTAKVDQDGGWDGPMSVYNRSTGQYMAHSMMNLTFGLGGISPEQLIGMDKTSMKLIEAAEFAANSADPNQYMGVKMVAYLPTETNVDGMEFFFDKIPSKMDPRMFFNFSFPGVTDNTMQFAPLTKDNDGNFKTNQLKYFKADGTETEKLVNFRAAYTWFTIVPGTYGTKGARMTGWITSADQVNYPNIAANVRNNDRDREWFNAAESYFLIAEAAHYGWSAGMSAQAAYEAGIQASFDSYGIGSMAGAYIASQEYNRVGTSVAFDHVAEAAPKAMQYVDFADETNLEVVDAAKNVYRLKNAPTLKSDYNYSYKPKGFYATNNDQLTKIITQKYIANMPWVPLEAWCDYRRVGLPFKEKPMLAEGGSITSMPNYTAAEAIAPMTVKYVPQRLKYPSSMAVNSAALYNQALTLLGGPDEVATPMPWSKK